MLDKIVCLLLIFVHHSCFSQILISGKIISTKNEPLAYTNVVCLKSQNGANTDSSGTFLLTIQEITDSVKITSIGYEPLILSLADLQKYKVVQLKEKTVSLKEVIVHNFSAFKNEQIISFGKYKDRGGWGLLPRGQLGVYIKNDIRRDGWLKKIKFGIKKIDFARQVLSYAFWH